MEASSHSPVEVLALVWFWYQGSVFSLQTAVLLPSQSTSRSAFQNTAWVHFDALQTKETRYGRRIIYGGHVISLARAISFDGLENALWMLAWNGATHANPTFASDTLYAFTDVVEKVDLGRGDEAQAEGAGVASSP